MRWGPAAEERGDGDTQPRLTRRGGGKCLLTLSPGGANGPRTANAQPAEPAGHAGHLPGRQAFSGTADLDQREQRGQEPCGMEEAKGQEAGIRLLGVATETEFPRVRRQREEVNKRDRYPTYRARSQ